MADKVDLDKIKNIPEDEFKKNLFEWVEQMDISKELQSKLRSDLFQNFGKTALGRQIAVQYQQSQRMVLSPMVLVINTLVAEFLYAQNCHFSLSVFSSEVPYKNVLPDFEKVKKFRFDSMELEEIMKALNLDHSDADKTEITKMYKMPQERDGTLVDTSLLFCIIKTLSRTVSSNGLPGNDAKVPQQLHEDDNSCHHCKNNRKKAKNDELNSKYYKHFYKYLELLSQHVVEISENTKKLKEPTNPDDQSSMKTCQLNKRLDKITESLTNLSKSNRKARKVTEIIKSITRLTNEIERCSSNVTKYLNAVNKSSKDSDKNGQLPTNYTDWLNQMTGSQFGQRFIKNLENAQQKAINNEVQRIKENFNEKLQTTRKLIKLNYKQKTFEKFRSTMLRSPVMQSRRDDFNELIDEKLRLLKEKENYWKQHLMRASTQMTGTTEMPQNPPSVPILEVEPTQCTKETVLPTNCSKVQPNIQPKIKKPIDIEVFNEPLRPIEPVIDNMVLVAKNRLQELEIESEQLDKSFQSYLKKQNEQKRVLTDDINKVWQQYARAKDNIMKTFVVPERRNMATIHQFPENVCPVPIPIAIEEPIMPLMMTESNQFRNPYKILHANLTTTGSLDPPTNKKEIAIQANDNVHTLALQPNERIASADKVSQIPVPMKIKSIMKKPMGSDGELITHLRISTSNDNPLSDASDASSYMNLKNISSSDAVHLSDSKPSDASLKSKPSEISLNSPVSIRSERLRIAYSTTRKSNNEPIEAVANDIIPLQANNEAKQHSATGVTIHNTVADTKDISALFQKIEIKNNLMHSSSSESSSVGRKISTGHKSSSSDEFWK